MRFSVGILIGLLFVTPALALETDQFTLPPQPLADLGPVVDFKAAYELRHVVADANTLRARELQLARDASTKAKARAHREAAHAAVSQQAIADAFYHAIAGGGVPECKIEDWVLDKHSIRSTMLQPMPVGGSVYGANPFERPFLLVELSPTLNFHGQYVGVDKLGHFFQQGHEYYERFIAARCQGASEAEATRVAIAGGVKQEHGFYGEAIIGIYSNADLAANYCGLLMYRNLVEPITVHGQTLEPLVMWDGDRLVVSDRLTGDWLQPYVSDHWNEAMNPCHYVGYWRPWVKERIAGKVDAWMTFNHSTPALEAKRLTRITTIDGVDYGHSGWRDVVTLVNAGAGETVASR